MSDTPDMTTCTDTSPTAGDAASPFYAVNYHFGMLLGVDEFATEQQHHRGKMRLHNAWLHRDGVVWGMDVRIDVPRGEIRVLPGLALDAAGHELHLDGDACVNVAEWFQVHKDDAGFEVTETGTGVRFDAQVEIRFSACLTRQVPALMEPCEGGAGGTAYSRVFETVDLRLVPRKDRDQPPAPYHRLRVLFGLEPATLPADQIAVDERDAVLALPQDQRGPAYVAALRKLAAFDEIDLKPAQSADDTTRLIYPATGDSPLLLADVIGITLDRSGPTNALTLTGGTVDVTVRPSHIATAAIQELLCGPSPVAAAGAGIGPRVIDGSVKLEDDSIEFELDKDLKAPTVTPAAFSAFSYNDTDGWEELTFTASFASGPPRVTLKFAAPFEDGALLRVIAKGTGPTPLLGADLLPLAGLSTGPLPPTHDGLDFVFMQVRS